MSEEMSLSDERSRGRLTVKEVGIIILHALVGWTLCGAIMGIGMQFMSLDMTLIIHAIGAPIIFTAVSYFYFSRFHFTTPLQTALSFVAVVILMDFFVVSLLINRNLEMFASILGTWLVFALIFISTYLTGVYVEKRR